MKRLLNTLYVNQPDVYMALDGDNIVLLKGEEKLGRLPLHNLEAIVAFGYTGASPALMGYCADRNIAITFYDGDRQISGQGHWTEQRKCSAAEKAIPCL